MATITPEITRVESNGGRSFNVLWENLGNGDTGEEIELQPHSDRSVQVVGTFGSGGTLQVQGSNDGSNWVLLTNPNNDNLSFTSAGLEHVLELTRYIRVEVTAGDGSTDLDVYMFVAGGPK